MKRLSLQADSDCVQFDMVGLSRQTYSKRTVAGVKPGRFPF